MGSARKVVGAAAVIGIAFDVLLWGQFPRLGLTLFLLLVPAMLVATTYAAGARPHRGAWLLLLPTGLLALGPVLREEPMTTALTTLASLSLSALVAHFALDGSWLGAPARSYAHALRRLTGAATLGGATVITAASRDVRAELAPSARRVVPVLRGLAMAFPVLLFFGVLLGSADPVFANRMGDVFSWLRPRPIDEVFVRAALVLLATYATAGVYMYALRARPDQGVGMWHARRRWGITEAAIVLGSVNLLFAAFVAVQVQYLFGGTEHLVLADLTYSEYARRGFVELLFVAGSALVLLLVLAGFTKRLLRRDQQIFSWLAGGLTVLVLVILASAFQRLGLYEEAFGFTRVRTYVHVFMVWLALLLVAVLVLEASNRLRWVATAAVIAAMGFTLTLSTINVDGFIATQNVARAASGNALDGAYLANVSVDAVPALVAAARDAGPLMRTRIEAQLACHQLVLDEDRAWQSASVSAARARSALLSYPVDTDMCAPSYW